MWTHWWKYHFILFSFKNKHERCHLTEKAKTGSQKSNTWSWNGAEESIWSWRADYFFDWTVAPKFILGPSLELDHYRTTCDRLWSAGHRAEWKLSKQMKIQQSCSFSLNWRESSELCLLSDWWSSVIGGSWFILLLWPQLTALCSKHWLCFYQQVKVVTVRVSEKTIITIFCLRGLSATWRSDHVWAHQQSVTQRLGRPAAVSFCRRVHTDSVQVPADPQTVWQSLTFAFWNLRPSKVSAALLLPPERSSSWDVPLTEPPCLRPVWVFFKGSSENSRNKLQQQHDVCSGSISKVSVQMQACPLSALLNQYRREIYVTRSISS